MPDWIKKEDEEFNTQASAFHAWVNTPANATAAGLSTPEVDAVHNAWVNWDTTYAAHLAHVAAAIPITAGKDTARGQLETAMRPTGKVMRARHDMGTLSDAQILAAAMPLTDDTLTAAPAPTTRPLLRIEAGQRLEHTVRWTDETTPGSRAKPAGVKHMELRVAVVAQGQPAPADPDAFTYYTVPDQASPNIVAYDPADAGKEAHMIGRWVSKRDEPGPWSVAVSATVRA